MLDAFSATYSEARDKFLAAARHRDARITSYRHPSAQGPAGEPLYLDVSVIGELDAQAMMVVGCGTHGIEGFSGSAAQTAWMRGDDPMPTGAAVTRSTIRRPATTCESAITRAAGPSFAIRAADRAGKRDRPSSARASHTGAAFESRVAPPVSTRPVGPSAAAAHEPAGAVAPFVTSHAPPLSASMTYVRFATVA